MNRLYFLFIGIGMIFFFFGMAPCTAQLHHSVVGTTWVDYATAYSNGYKIVPVLPPWPESILYAVYSYNADTCYFAYSYDLGETWQSQPLFATTWGNAHCPSLDVYGSLPYVVSEGDSGGKGEIFLKCPLDWCIPQRISYTPGHSTLPAIVIDTSGNMHIVWQDDTPGDWEIYYCCAQYQAGISEVINLSSFSDGPDVYPSISIYNGDEVHVIWERYDPRIYCPYCIVHRSLSNGIWSDEEFLAGCTGIPLHHPSLDFSHGEDSLSAAWEDSSLGKSDAYFYGGNGGGFLTPGDSRYPVVSTMGDVWSYLYWEDQSDGYDDIYAHLYYFINGWSSYKFRDVFGEEAMHHPSVANCYVIWTQGDSAPYKVMFCREGYPIGIAFIRGDADGSGALSISDGLWCFRYQFVPGWTDSCRCDDAIDADDNGMITLGDCLRILRKQFVPGWQDSIPQPCPNCGPDSTPDGLGCESHPCMGAEYRSGKMESRR